MTYIDMNIIDLDTIQLKPYELRKTSFQYQGLPIYSDAALSDTRLIEFIVNLTSQGEIIIDNETNYGLYLDKENNKYVIKETFNL